MLAADAKLPAPSIPDLLPSSDSGPSQTDNITNVRQPFFSGSGPNGKTIQVYRQRTDVLGQPLQPREYLGSVNVGAFSAWGFQLTDEAKRFELDGFYDITARSVEEIVVDGISQVDETTASDFSDSLKLRFLATTPPQPARPNLDAGSDSKGVSDSDDITSVTRPLFTGTVTAGSTVEVFATRQGSVSVSLGTTTAASESGDWELRPSNGNTLVDGDYDIAIKILDLAGNVSPASDPLLLTIDTAAPGAPSVPALVPGDDSPADVNVPPDNITNVTQPRFTGSAESGVFITLVAEDKNGVRRDVGRGTADTDGRWTVKAEGLLPGSPFEFTDGTWKIFARAEDVAGNTKLNDAGLTVTIQTALPAAPTDIALKNDSDSGESNTDGVTNVTRPTFLGRAPVGTIVRVFWRNTNGADPEQLLGATAAGENGQWILDFPADVNALADGVYAVEASATDTAGNESARGQLTSGLWIDTQAPRLQSLAPAVVPDNEPVPSVEATFDEDVYRLNADDFVLSAVINGTRRQLSLASTATVETDSGDLGDDAWTIGNLARLAGASGDYSIALNKSRFDGGKVEAWDLAGNLLVYSARSATWTTDVTAPTVTSIVAIPTPTPTTTISPWNTGVDSVRVVFDSAVTGVDPSDFRLTRDGQSIDLGGAMIGGSGTTWTLNGLGALTVEDGRYEIRLVANGSDITDTSGTGNKLFIDAATTWEIDTTPPVADFSAIDTPRATPVGGIDLDFVDDLVIGVELGDFALTRDGNTVSLAGVTLSPATGAASRFTLNGLAAITAAPGNYRLTFNRNSGTKVADDAGNVMAANPADLTWTVDTTRPKVASITLTPAGTPVNEPVTEARVEFTMPVTGVDLADFRLTRNGLTVALTDTRVTQDPDIPEVWVLEIPAATTAPDGVYVLGIVASATGIAGEVAPFNPLEIDVQENKHVATWTMDATRPTVALSVVGRQGAVFTIRALFSETVTGFSPGDDITIERGAIGNPRNGGLVGREFLFDVTPNVGNPILPVTLSVNDAAAQDGAGNDNVASPTLRLVSDTTPPTVRLTAPTITNQNPFSVTATFSEPVTGLTAAGVSVAPLASVQKIDLSAVNPDNGFATTWTILVTPAKNGPVTVGLLAGAARDQSDNLSLASSTVRVEYDGTQPTVTLRNLSGSPTRSGTISVAATFSEPVTGVSPGDLKVTNAIVVGVSGSGTNYIFQVQPGPDGTIDLNLPADSAVDRAGNGNSASNALSIVSDRSAPKVLAITGPVGGDITITFTEVVRGFDIRDLSLSRNGQTISLTGVPLQMQAADPKVWVLTPGTRVSSSGTYRLEVLASKSGIVDLAGNPLADDRRSPFTTLIYTFTIDTSPPTATFSGIPTITNVSVDVVGVAFNKPVTGVDLGDFTLSRDGAVVGRLADLPGVSLTPTTGPEARYVLTGLAPWTALPGRYALQLVAAGADIVDGVGNFFRTATTATWALDVAPPTATLGPVAAVVSGPISSIPVRFSETVRGVDPSDFTLTRDGVVVPLRGATLPAPPAGGSSFLLANLSPLTAVRGTYVLTLRNSATGIVDAAGNPLASSAEVAWQNAGPPPTGTLGAAFGPVTPNPRTVPVASMALTFTASVTGVGPEDFTLTRTIAGVTTIVDTQGLTVTGVGANRTIGGLSALTEVPGDYTLRLRSAGSGIATSTGQVLASDVTRSWRMNEAPAAPEATVSLDLPVSPGAAYDAVTVTFSKEVTGVRLSAFVLTRGGIPVSLTGTVLARLSPTTYRISGLAPIVAATLPYELRLVASNSGIVGIDGSRLQRDASVGWVQMLPSVRAAFLGLERLTTAPVPAAKLRFSESVRGVDLTDFELTVERNGTTEMIALRGVTVTGSGTSWTVGNLAALQSGPGTYVLRLKRDNGDIKTSLGDTLAEDATVEWRVG